MVNLAAYIPDAIANNALLSHLRDFPLYETPCIKRVGSGPTLINFVSESVRPRACECEDLIAEARVSYLRGICFPRGHLPVVLTMFSGLQAYFLNGGCS